MAPCNIGNRTLSKLPHLLLLLVHERQMHCVLIHGGHSCVRCWHITKSFLVLYHKLNVLGYLHQEFKSVIDSAAQGCREKVLGCTRNDRKHIECRLVHCLILFAHLFCESENFQS